MSVLCPDCKSGRILRHDRCDVCGLSDEDMRAAADLLAAQTRRETKRRRKRPAA